MVTYRNIHVKTRSGKSRIQRALVLASGKLRFVKNLTRSRPTRARHQTSKIRSVRHMARRYRKKRHFRSFNPFNLGVKVAKLGAIAVPAYYQGMQYPTTQEKIVGGLGSLAGYNLSARKFEGSMLLKAWTPFIAVTLGAVAVRKINGLIRRM